MLAGSEALNSNKGEDHLSPGQFADDAMFNPAFFGLDVTQAQDPTVVANNISHLYGTQQPGAEDMQWTPVPRLTWAELWPWQRHFAAMWIKSISAFCRIICYLWEPAGSVGKSMLCRYCEQNLDGLHMSGTDYHNTANALFNHCKVQGKGPRLIMLDRSRSEVPVDWATVEALKLGSMFNSKCQANAFTFGIPMVVIFANQAPVLRHPAGHPEAGEPVITLDRFTDPKTGRSTVYNLSEAAEFDVTDRTTLPRHDEPLFHDGNGHAVDEDSDDGGGATTSAGTTAPTAATPSVAERTPTQPRSASTSRVLFPSSSAAATLAAPRCENRDRNDFICPSVLNVHDGLDLSTRRCCLCRRLTRINLTATFNPAQQAAPISEQPVDSSDEAEIEP